MIDLNTIKDERPRKGPARMSKSEKSRAQEEWQKARSKERWLKQSEYSHLSILYEVVGFINDDIEQRRD